MSRYIHIAIIGAGPAGCAAAIKLAAEPGITVTLIERSDFRDYRPGETLPPQIAGLLADLGVWYAFLAIEPVVASQVQSAWASTELQNTSLLLQPYGRGWHIRRAEFDALLLRAAKEAGATVLAETKVQSIQAHASGHQLSLYSAQNGRSKLSADWVIDASGRARKMARMMNVRPVHSDLQLALVGFCVLKRPARVYEDIGLLLETVSGGWLYCAPVTVQEGVVVLMSNQATLQTVKQPETLWQQAIRDSIYIRERLGAYHFPAEVMVYPSRSQLAGVCYGENWVAIGDAAMTFDPLTGMGITKALADAKTVAGQILRAYRSGAKPDFSAYARQQHSAFWQYVATRRAYYRMEKRWPDSLYWRDVQQ